jgi:hypothetical protein
MAGLKHPQKLFAVFVFFAIVSCVIVAACWSYREIPIDGDFQYLDLDPAHQYLLTRKYKVVLESLDDVSGTVHLRAELHVSPPKGFPLFEFVEEPFKTDEIRKHPIPAQILFGPFEITDYSDKFPFPPWILGQHPEVPKHIIPPANYSEVAPVSTQADVLLIGAPWLYPFDKYLITAEVRCMILATPDRKQYFRIVGDGYYLASKIPNVLIRNAEAKDVEYWTKKIFPYEDHPNMYTQGFKAGAWRDGAIILVLERPLFPKFLAVFFGIVALVWLAFVAFVSDPKQLSLNAVGYFLAIWAIRAPLAAGAPKVDTLLLDYVTLGLYTLLVAVVLAKFIWGFRKT